MRCFTFFHGFAFFVWVLAHERLLFSELSRPVLKLLVLQLLFRRVKIILINLVKLVLQLRLSLLVINDILLIYIIR